MNSPVPRGRATNENPAPRSSDGWFDPSDEERQRRARDGEQTRLIDDVSQTILAENNSPDIPFRFSINPYRGCEHGCAYCYARPTHEYLGFSAGLDFETRIVVKRNAAKLLREAFSRSNWEPQVVAMSGVTDPYQPVEKDLGITRSCLEVLAQFRNPVGLITKNVGILRDLDLLREMAAWHGVRVAISLTTLDPVLARRMEPRTASPRQRLEVVQALREAGVPVAVMQAPVIPGLTDTEMPELIRAAAEAGAETVRYILLRLPGAVEGIFFRWLEQFYPGRRARVEERLRSMRDGRVNLSTPGERMKGKGLWAENLRQMHRLGLRRAGLSAEPDLSPLNTGAFRRPGGTQLDLFG
jgi:DNA repair photolyase